MPDDVCEMAQLLADLGKTVFFPIHVEGNWEKFPSYDSDWVEALKLFVGLYAFERAGAPRAYKEAAIQALEECKRRLTEKDAEEGVWKKFIIFFSKTDNQSEVSSSGKRLNLKNNCLNTTNNGKVNLLNFCNSLEEDSRNIYKFALHKIKCNKILEAHEYLRKIRGIGPKIASLFLRDISLKNCINDTNLQDCHLLQPIDIWVRRAVATLNAKTLTDQKASEELIKLANQAKCSALFLNAGIWYFGSQVAQTELQLDSDLKDPGSFRCAIERRRQKLENEATLLSAFLSPPEREAGAPMNDKPFCRRR